MKVETECELSFTASTIVKDAARIKDAVKEMTDMKSMIIAKKHYSMLSMIENCSPSSLVQYCMPSCITGLHVCEIYRMYDRLRYVNWNGRIGWERIINLTYIKTDLTKWLWNILIT